MSSLLFVLLLFGVIIYDNVSVNGESQICGYSGDSFICCLGYKKDYEGECTLPVCVNDCGQGGQCIRPDTCHCPDGRVSATCQEDGRQDNDIYERRKESRPVCENFCNGQGVCVDGKCQCHVGYSGDACLEKLIDQCYLSLSRGICQKLDNGIKLNIEVCCSAFSVAWGEPCQKCPKARCEKGWIEVDGICRDVDECTIPELCRNGRCQNFEGSYKCLCSTGFQFEPAKGDCVKTKDVCKERPRVCGSGMKCLALTTERYSCQCIEGYVKTKDHRSCVPKEKSSFDFCNVYGSYVCQNGKCKPEGNNYKCECNPGYRPSGDEKSCKKNIDYCSLYQNVLCPNGMCVPIGDDYMCKCDTGYTPSFNRKKCTSVCDLYPDSLCPNARCIPQSGGDYECRCNDGYSAIGKGKQCRRIMNDQSGSQSSNAASTNDNQASYDVDYCSYDYYRKQCLGGRCINKKGFYHCECLSGHVSDQNGLACKKIDSPSSGQMLDMAGSTDLKSYCDKYGSFLCTNGHCVESGSSYQCRCSSGYKESSDGKSCYDVDECSTDTNVCVQGTCTNSPGSYQCSCYDGFTIHYVPGGPKCYDRNECEEDQLLCTNGLCINKWGSYHCSCNAGFSISSDNKQCVPVRFREDSNDSSNEKRCKYCLNACTKVNSTFYRCECANGLSAVLNTGLCAPMTEVVDIQFDLPTRNSDRRKRAIDSPREVFFQLLPEANRNLFLSKIRSQYRNIVVNECTIVSEPNKDGVRCLFHSEGPN